MAEAKAGTKKAGDQRAGNNLYSRSRQWQASRARINLGKARQRIKLWTSWRLGPHRAKSSRVFGRGWKILRAGTEYRCMAPYRPKPKPTQYKGFDAAKG